MPKGLDQAGLRRCLRSVEREDKGSVRNTQGVSGVGQTLTNRSCSEDNLEK